MSGQLKYYIARDKEVKITGKKYRARAHELFSINSPDKFYETLDVYNPKTFCFNLYLALIVKDCGEYGFDIQIIREFTDQEYYNIFGISKAIDDRKLVLSILRPEDPEISRKKLMYVVRFNKKSMKPGRQVHLENRPAIKLYQFSDENNVSIQIFAGYIRGNKFVTNRMNPPRWHTFFNDLENKEKTYSYYGKCVIYNGIVNKWYEFNGKTFEIIEHENLNPDTVITDDLENDEKEAEKAKDTEAENIALVVEMLRAQNN